jgi:hypothetical protein
MVDGFGSGPMSGLDEAAILTRIDAALSASTVMHHTDVFEKARELHEALRLARALLQERDR